MNKKLIEQIEDLVYQAKELVLHDRNPEAYTSLREALDLLYKMKRRGENG